MKPARTTKWIRIAGHSAAVHVWPAECPGAPVFLALHGFTGSGMDFLPLREAMGGPRFTWICPDFMGHGSSESPDCIDPYLLVNAFFLIDAARRLGEQAGRVHLLAYSMGGRLGLHYLRRASPLQAMFIGASPGLAGTDDRRARREADAGLIRPGPAAIGAFCDKWESQPLIAPQTRLAEPLRSELANRRRTNNPAGLRNTLLACGAGVLPDLWKDLPRLPPAHLLHGERDGKFSAIAEEMERIHPRFTRLSVPACGHSPHLENPGGLARLLLDAVL